MVTRSEVRGAKEQRREGEIGKEKKEKDKRDDHAGKRSSIHEGCLSFFLFFFRF